MIASCCVYMIRPLLSRAIHRTFYKNRSRRKFYNNVSSENQRRDNTPMYLQVIGTGSSEISPSIFLFTEGGRYLFNCSESVQTVFHEHGVKFSKLHNVFLTRMNWENIGGLPGLLMSLRERTSHATTIHGPSSLHRFKSISAASFLKQESLTMNINTCPLDSDSSPLVHRSDELSVKGYEVFNNSYEEDLVKRRIQIEEEGVDLPSPKQPCLRNDHEGSVVFYVCQISKTIGKFHPEKAQQLGVPKGKLYGELVAGNAVVTPAGRTVFPLEVMDPDEPGPCFIVIECPSVNFIPRLVEHPQLQKGIINPNIIVHIAPRQVIENTLYQEWFESFGDTIRNVFVHRETCKPEVVMRSCYKLQIPLNLIDSNIFHIPTIPYSNHSYIESRPSCISANSLMKLYLKPRSKYGLIEDKLPPFEDCVDGYVTDVKTNTKLISKLEKNLPDVQKRIASVSATSIVTHMEAILPKESSVTFLGTASSAPSQYRSLSAILVHLPSAPGFMFLDCGEGTLRQLYKCYGEEVADYILSNLKCVFVSHIHGDHHLGLIRIIQRRHKLLRLRQQKHSASPVATETIPPLLIIGPNILRGFMEEYRRSCEHLLFWFLNAKLFVEDQSNESPALPPALCPRNVLPVLQGLGLTSFETVNVIHVAQSFGVVLTHKEGWKLVYSGDTRPCEDLVTAGKGASLLVHEATFDNSLQEEAELKRHSTMADAMKISTSMEAKFTVLTHFSQRYGKFSTAFKSNALQHSAIAFDFMTVPIAKENRKLEDVQPLIHNIFKILNFEIDDDD